MKNCFMLAQSASLLLLISLMTVFMLGCRAGNGRVIESTGTIEATQIDVRAEVGGQILKLYVDEGSRVKPGDLLAEIDREKIECELQAARGRVQELEARLSLLQHGYRQEEVAKAREALREAEVLMVDAQRDNERISRLFTEGVVSHSVRDSAEAAYNAALQRYKRAQQEYALLQEGFRSEEIAAAQAAWESAVASQRRIERSLRDATVRSPVTGIISERYVEPGELVSPGSILYSITDLTDIWIMAYVSEKNLGKIKVGQSGYVIIDTYPNEKFPGTVVFISPEAEFTPKNIQTKEERVKLVYAVKVKLSNEREILKPGMPADVVIEAE
ncbi:MAG: efflux RND transporter periplasmic adaptor subunit [Desulfobacterota bacterium]|nr:efflux RND transporter periplasmic adaptor subunit [Thermodesulfobacteriota bacterium]